MARKKKQPVQTQEEIIIRQVMNQEVAVSDSNYQKYVSDYEFAIDMLECERTERNMDWMSDIYIPEFAAQMLTQSSVEANQYFQTRDFVEVYIEDGQEEYIKAAEANKELINRTLNQRHLRNYQKFMRANLNKNLGGLVYVKCAWERRDDKKIMPFETLVESSEFDINNNPLVDRTVQVPRTEIAIEQREVDVTVIDRFNYDILDRRNVFTDNTYAYSLQEKKWIVIREEKTLNELKAEASQEGYTNLESLEDINPDLETKTSKESYNKDENFQKSKQIKNNAFDVYHRYGQFWAIVKGRDRFGNPLPDQVEIGIDINGEPVEKAELIECIISIAESGSTRRLIRFIAQPCIDSSGFVYRPLIRGLCYIHPSKDIGLGDGKYARELQTGINDTFNLSNDRVTLATLPTLKGRKSALEDNDTLYFEPQHMMEMENPDDVTEFVIKDNIQGALNQIAQLTQAMSKVTGKFNPQIGGVPELASTTATAVAGAQANSNQRDNYRALTFEHTFLNEFYWMITQMTWQFATEDTGFKLMGEKLYDFDPSLEFTYKPLSQSVQSEYSKANQIRELNQMMSVLAPTVAVNPKGAMLINFIVSRIFELFGDEHQTFAKALLDEKGPVGAQTGTNQPIPMMNQTGLPQTGAEMAVRA